MNAIAPNGKRIIGTLELIRGCSQIQEGSWAKAEKPKTEDGHEHEGGVRFDYDGETEVWWDEQKTEKTAAGKRLFLDEGNETWTIDQIKLVED